MPDSALIVDGISHAYADTPVLADVSFEVQPGELVAVLGASGSGKTTLLRAIAGFVTPAHGRISVAGRAVTEAGRDLVAAEARRIGLVFQDYALFGHMTVADNVGFGVVDPRARVARVAELLALVGLTELADRRPGALSGGQQQRVALARALAPKPALMLLDEPFANLDAGLRAGLRAQVKNTLREAGATTLLVTHDRTEALALADRVVVLGPATGDGPGTVLQIGTPAEVYERPTSRAAAALTGPVQFVAGEAQGETATTALGEVPLWSPASGPGAIAIRPEQLDFEATPEGPDRVTACQYLGRCASVFTTGPAGDLRADVPATVPAALGAMGRMTVRGPCAWIPQSG